MEELLSELCKTQLFQGMGVKELKVLLENKPYRLREFENDMYVAHSQDVCNDLFMVVRGSVRGEMTDFSGKKLKIEDIAAPRPLAAAFIFGRENRFPVDIIANEPATIMIIPRDVLIFLLQNSQVILKNYLNTISSRAQFLSGKIRFLSFKTIREKIANYILMHSAKDDQTFTLDQSQTELADFFGVTRPSLARTLARMEEEGMIRTKRREITILNREKLNNLLHNS
jgi:CRP/FNR family transcriptional regulator, dissimilatory nitrate respiration regulator